MTELMVNEHSRKQKEIYELGKDKNNIYQYIAQ